MVATLKLFLMSTIFFAYVTMMTDTSVVIKAFCFMAIVGSIVGLSEIHHHGREVKR